MQAKGGVESRLRGAATLPDILAASFDAFEIIRLIARASEDAEPALFAAFMTAADAAVDGREAITAAPSFPLGAGPKVSGGLPAASRDGMAAVTGAMTTLAALLGERLSGTTVLPATPGDRAACEHGAAAAGQICQLMAGGP